MKYYSEVLNKNFDTIEDLESAEKAEKEKVLAKTKEDAARKAEIDAAKKVCDAAKVNYVVAFKAYQEALDRLNAVERELAVLENKNRAAAGQHHTYDEFKKLVERCGLGDWFLI